MKRVVSFCLSCVLVLCAAAAGAASSEGIVAASPESVGFSSERLKKLDAAMHKLVDAGELPGMLTMIARHGKLVHSDVYGVQDIASRKPLTADTIFRIHSMTKPITGVAMMILYEEGRWLPSDPLSRHVPELANLKVFAGLDPQGKPILEALSREPTLGELMTHTAGFIYGFNDTPLDRMFREADPFTAGSTKEMIQRLAKVPLRYQPGTQWEYGAAVDVQGYIVERLSGQSLWDFMRERIFTPLGMKDTAFHVPQDKLPRLATGYRAAMKDGKLEPVPHDSNVTRVPGFAGGGGGLYSTAGDYLRFAQMLANGGSLGAVRILAPRTVELMRANKLAPHLRNDGQFGISFQRMNAGFGFGYDVAVFDDPLLIGSPVGKGTYLWDGAAGTFFFIDPTNDIVFIGMQQRLVNGPVPPVQFMVRPLTYQAVIDPEK
jgi:CubicO group peptidase (beta-lactamase class C family)